MILLAVIGIAGVTLAPAAAHDNSAMVEYGGWAVGPIRLPNGSLVYCLEPGTLTPSSAIGTSTVVDELRGYSVRTIDVTGWNGVVSTSPISGRPLQHMNYVLHTYGESTDSGIRVAVQLALWQLRQGSGEGEWLQHHLSWVQAHGGEWVVQRAEEMVSEARQVISGLDEAPPVPALEISWDGEMVDGLRSGVLRYPVGTESLSISGARFQDGSAQMVVDPAEPGSVPWAAHMHLPGWSAQHEVNASGVAVVTREQFPAQLVLHPLADAVEQTLGSAVGPLPTTEHQPFAEVKLTHSELFQPELHTQVTEQVVHTENGVFADEVTVTAGQGSEWPSRSIEPNSTEFLPLIADGVLYGPFLEPQSASQHVPDNAPVAAETRLEIDSGPGTYRAQAAINHQPPGYYYWQWSISGKRQEAAVIESQLLPDNYDFSDEFGLQAESHRVPFDVEISTQIESNSGEGAELSIQDRVTLTLNNEDGYKAELEKSSFKVRLRAFHELNEPVQAQAVSPDAVQVDEIYVDAHFNSSHLSPRFEIPAGLRGWISVQACVISSEQSPQVQELVVDVCDDYGVPAETLALPATTLSTTGSSGTLDASSGWLFGSLAFGGLTLMICAVLRSRLRVHSNHQRECS